MLAVERRVDLGNREGIPERGNGGGRRGAPKVTLGSPEEVMRKVVEPM